ncbi:Transcriptional regulator, MarR family OS=Castellaniella defragrans (strain DSM / CCUG 39792/ 65Phen) OX=1437824 GN=BN940_17826 PE=4 SV=1 [Castellaniella denitrificans]|uniref:MarR family winged helix-turn-helix transcriptional regulator n=1 Tax=Castellaniella sp. TaxID=1955812 RepID=UPI002AFF5516|nr:MarR family transcriptional regulator [Castellaniella sp.]
MTDYTQYAATQHPSVTPPVPDLETQATGQEPQDLRLWLRMLSCCTLIENELRSRLRTEFQTTLPRFDLMSQLTHAPKGLKMSELSRLMMVTNGNITGITDQLEKDGLVERLKDDSDRRSSLIRLTLKGRRYHRRMQRAHATWIQSLLGGLAPTARTALFDLLGDLKQSTYARLPAI